jgi:hypothetical protein
MRLSLRQKKLVGISSGVMAMSGVLFPIIGIAKGLGGAYGVGAATLRVAGANAWLARRAPTRAGDITDPEVTWRRADPRMASAVRRVPSRQSRSGRNNPRH